jgi:hypothetical protein
MRHLMLAVLITAVILLGACAKETPAPEVILTPEEVLACLTELHITAIQEVNQQVDDLNEKIAAVEEKETRLTEIETLIDEAIAGCDEEMADKFIGDNMYWLFTMPEEYLEFYQNECYKLVKFETQYHYSQDRQDDIPFNIFLDIIIMDKASGVQDAPEVFEERLAVEKSPYVRERTAKLEAAEKASTVLNEMLQYADSWEIREEGNQIYSISGYGLGYTDQLTTGEWLYYMGPQTMEPQSPNSIKLKNILTAKTGG